MDNLIGICLLSSIPVRTENKESSEMCTQLMFGERYKVLEEKDRWIKIRCLYDDYIGFIDIKLFEPSPITNSNIEPIALKEQLVWVRNENTGITFPIGRGSSLFAYNKETKCIELGLVKYCVQGVEASISISPEEILKTYLNTPYLWGGRSFFGIDCSGLSQVFYKLQGLKLSRDASQQVLEGEEVEQLSDVKFGDLAFFENENNKITHVGILLSDKEIIHASGFVRQDKIDQQGIFIEKGIYTHRLHSIRRYSH